MHSRRSIFGRAGVTRALALLAFAAMLYFAAGGSFLHHHTDGSDNTACHICQALHMPALAAARLDLVSVPEFITRYSSLPRHDAPSDPFALHRASRGPPTA